MEIYRELEKSHERLSVALGFFDGLHSGHMSVINAAVAERAKGMSPAVLTFSESPQAKLSGGKISRLMTREKRRELLKRAGIERLYELEFDEVRNLGAEEFVEKVLKNTLAASAVYCGFNYRFGRFGAGDEGLLHRLCSRLDIAAHTMPPVIYNGEPVSSTRIRESLENGDVKSANEMLARRFSFDFKVGRGNQIGRKMETPTINQVFPKDFILPRFGVYATYASIGGKKRPAVTNIGVKPTVGSERPLAETWILDGDAGDLYGSSPEVELVEFIRPEKRFLNLDELQAAIKKDGETAKNIFKAAGPSL